MRAPRRPSGSRAVHVRFGRAPGGVGGHRVVRVVAGDRVEQDRGVPDRAGHRPQGVARGVGGHHPVAADQRHRGPQADEAVHRGRAANGAAGILADGDEAEVRGGAGPAAPRRPARVAGRVVGVADDAEAGPDVARGELPHGRLGEDDGPRLAHPGDDGGVAPRHEPVEQRRAVGRRHVAGLDLVLQQHRHAVEGAGRPRLRERGVEGLRLLRHARIDVLDGVQRGPGLVVGLDAGEIALDQLAARQLARRESGVDLVDGRLHQAEVLGAGCARHRQREREDDGRRTSRSRERRVAAPFRRRRGVSCHGVSLFCAGAGL